MKKIYVLAAAAIMAASSATSVMAQSPLSFGVRAGLNFNTLRAKGADIFKDYGAKVGFNVGGQVNYNFTDMFGLQSGLLLNTYGYKYDKDGRKRSYSFYELQLPVFLTGTFSLSDDFKIKANAGPTFGVGLSGKYESERDGDKDESDLYKKEEGDDDAEMKRFQMGIAFGAGVEFKKIYLGVGYDLGLTNISTYDKDGFYIKSGRFMINVGYTF
jgi:hypothetical protein